MKSDVSLSVVSSGTTVNYCRSMQFSLMVMAKFWKRKKKLRVSGRGAISQRKILWHIRKWVFPFATFNLNFFSGLVSCPGKLASQLNRFQFLFVTLCDESRSRSSFVLSERSLILQESNLVFEDNRIMICVKLTESVQSIASTHCCTDMII